MAARRGKNQATRNSGHATPAWVWLVLGLLIGLAVYFIVPGLGKKDGDGFFRPQPNPDAQPAPIDSADVEAVVPDAPVAETGTPSTATGETGKETQYDFYTLLPGKEVQMSDAELAASAREEEARKARAALNGQSTAAVPAPAGNDTAQPAPIDEAPAPRATADAPRPADTAPAPKPAAAVASADTGARYILQAGAFGASGDAEATKAKIAMLGLSARVESAQINGKTVYRVRMGPYGTASELAEAKQKLASGGLPAMAVKAQ
ncbi:SPOR domain-containing protein [Pseudoxanthomonas sp. Root630]|uniref:SPOR domain-containing protein n=1 Tax=Pseudoxanthomonas sp. Root630 TaxID=1736574 RepID=UPI0007028C31|nr:SPOR domain-containing protein [Pseudoxanthomonas sp. Root630]KRA46235.1 sporulation protein [Pseudoxanthomonas sp. Root630]